MTSSVQKQIKVFLLDDHPLAVTGLYNMLLPYKNIKVTGTYQTGRALMEALSKKQPDVLLLDILLPDTDGKTLAREISQFYPSIKIIAVTSVDAPAYIKAMMQSGCSGYLLKNTDQETLVEAIHTVYQGEDFIEPSLKEQMVYSLIKKGKENKSEWEKAKGPRLTKREKDVLDLMVKDYSNREIADKLCLSIRTVERHRFNLMQKFDAKSPIGLLKAAMEYGLA